LKTVDAVSAIIFENDKFLVEKRKKDEPRDPGITCLPGGHVEANETREEALVREMREELDIKVKKAELITNGLWIASDGERQKVYYYLVTEYIGKPTCKVAKKILYIKDISAIDIEADRKAIRKTISYFKKH
jgi:mutator protein MutT